MQVLKRIIPLSTALFLMVPTITPIEAKAAGGPDWTNIGSGIYKSESGRVIRGVGTANWIKNTSLLRTMADEQARVAIASVLNTYVADLSKSYMASTTVDNKVHEEQQIENAMKAMTQAMLKGVMIVDRYVDQNGVMYSLAELDYSKMEEVLKAEAAGLVSYNTIDTTKVFDDLSSMLTPKTTTATRGTQSALPEVKAARDQAEKEQASSANGKKSKPAKIKKNKKRPDWVDGPSSSFPDSQYLCGVGIGADRITAENGAMAAISKIFKAEVAAVTSSYMASISSSANNGSEYQKVEQQIKVASQKSLRGAVVREVYEEKKGDVFVLTCIERGPAAIELREQIKEKDKAAEASFNEAQNGDTLRRMRRLNECRKTLLDRSLLNSDLRIINADGIGVPATVDFIDVQSALADAKDRLNIVINMDGEANEALLSAAAESFNKEAFQILNMENLPAEEEAPVVHLILHLNYHNEDAGMGGPGGKYYMNRGVVFVRIENGETSKDLITFELSAKEGYSNPEESVRRTIRTLSGKLKNKIGLEVKKYMDEE